MLSNISANNCSQSSVRFRSREPNAANNLSPRSPLPLQKRGLPSLPRAQFFSTSNYLQPLQPRANRSFQNLPDGKRKATIRAVNHSSKQYLPLGKDSA